LINPFKPSIGPFVSNLTIVAKNNLNIREDDIELSQNIGNIGGFEVRIFLRIYQVSIRTLENHGTERAGFEFMKRSTFISSVGKMRAS